MGEELRAVLKSTTMVLEVWSMRYVTHPWTDLARSASIHAARRDTPYFVQEVLRTIVLVFNTVVFVLLIVRPLSESTESPSQQFRKLVR